MLLHAWAASLVSPVGPDTFLLHPHFISSENPLTLGAITAYQASLRCVGCQCFPMLSNRSVTVCKRSTADPHEHTPAHALLRALLCRRAQHLRRFRRTSWAGVAVVAPLVAFDPGALASAGTECRLLWRRLCVRPVWRRGLHVFAGVSKALGTCLHFLVLFVLPA